MSRPRTEEPWYRKHMPAGMREPDDVYKYSVYWDGYENPGGTCASIDKNGSQWLHPERGGVGDVPWPPTPESHPSLFPQVTQSHLVNDTVSESTNRLEGRKTMTCWVGVKAVHHECPSCGHIDKWTKCTKCARVLADPDVTSFYCFAADFQFCFGCLEELAMDWSDSQ